MFLHLTWLPQAELQDINSEKQFVLAGQFKPAFLKGNPLFWKGLLLSITMILWCLNFTSSCSQINEISLLEALHTWIFPLGAPSGRVEQNDGEVTAWFPILPWVTPWQFCWWTHPWAAHLILQTFTAKNCPSWALAADFLGSPSHLLDKIMNWCQAQTPMFIYLGLSLLRVLFTPWDSDGWLCRQICCHKFIFIWILLFLDWAWGKVIWLFF